MIVPRFDLKIAGHEPLEQLAANRSTATGPSTALSDREAGIMRSSSASDRRRLGTDDAPTREASAAERQLFADTEYMPEP
jgi:hypothetical protein